MNRPRTLALSVAWLVLAAAIPAAADDSYPGTQLLSRSDWWPFETGPSYGEVAPESRFDPRVIRMPVGSFDTRSGDWKLPPALTLSDEAAADPSAPWIVQIRGPVTEKNKDALRSRGVRIYDYLPNNAFVVRASNPTALKGLPGVLWASPYHPAYRIEPRLGHAPTRDVNTATNESIYVRVRLFEPDENAATIEALQTLGAEIDFEATNGTGPRKDRVYFTAEPSVILAAARMHQVRWIEEVSLSGILLNAESKVVLQSGFIGQGTPMWDAGIDGGTQVVGVMDSGLDVDTILMSHTAADAGTPGPAHRKVLAYTPYGGGDVGTCAGSNGYAHGTNTTQCAVGNRVDFGHGDDLEGVAHGAKVVFQDIKSSSAFACLFGGISPPSSFLAAYDEVRTQGGRLTNGSFDICTGYGSHASDADEYAWDHKDFMIFFGAGNGGSGVACPGSAKNVVSVGGHYQDPYYDEFYGSTGPAPDGRMAPMVTGPACDHAGGNPAPFDYDTSTSIQSDDNDITGTPGTRVSEGRCGTSYSSPYVMGAGALVRDYFEKGFYPAGVESSPDALDPSGALVKAVLLNSGEYMTCGACGSFMGSQGMGRVNLSRSLAIAGDSRTPRGIRAIDLGASEGLATGGLFEERIEILDATVPFRVTLNWVDRSGSALVNDLRLTVIGPGGGPSRTYHGGNFSGRFSQSEAAGGANEDHTNPFEAVHVPTDDLVEGEWIVQVYGTNVPMPDSRFNDTQPFALVASGGFDSLGIPEVSPVGSASPLIAAGTDGDSVTWEWQNLNEPSMTYVFYRGDLPTLIGSGAYTHQLIDAQHCDLTGNSTAVSDRSDGQSSYYLVGARENGRDGPLGHSRPPAAPACP